MINFGGCFSGTHGKLMANRQKQKRPTNSCKPLIPNVSGYQDSNLGPPAPKAGALTGLRYIPFSGDKDKQNSLLRNNHDIFYFYIVIITEMINCWNKKHLYL